VEGEVRYVLGSGARAFAFLIERDGTLFESPATWFSQGRRWDLSPGFEAREGRFERQITPGCLVCHANRVEHVAGTEGRYRPPTFRGHAIGCERCHGPGELHVRRPVTRPGEGPNIVNPRDLAPALREAVCQQCHLMGVATIAPRGRSLAEYRPGLPLQEFQTVFVRAEPGEGEHPNADHVEQMHRSRCFVASKGAMSCLSCHNPHALPAAGEKTAFYRGRCLDCHARRGCALDEAARRAQNPDDSCIACHMPRASTTDITHVATTLHSIPRLGDAALARANASANAGRPARSDAIDLVPFHRDQMTPEQLRSTRRDLGVALRHRGGEGAARALELLRPALAEHPDDVLASESEGFALWGMGRDEEALSAFERTLRRAPEQESALEAAALLAGQLRRRDDAIAYWRRAIAVDPWRSSFHANLGYQLTRLQQWPEAAESARRALRINPASTTARSVLVLSTLRMGRAPEAQAEFETLLQFDPPDPDGLVQWFRSLR
jgi:tetratricopeptide (TPR) repeat protein